MKTRILAAAAAIALMTGGAFAQTSVATPPPSGLSTEEQQRIFSERMREMNERLDRLVTEMNAAAPDKKQDAIASVVNELVSQRKALQEQIEQLRAQEANR